MVNFTDGELKALSDLLLESGLTDSRIETAAMKIYEVMEWWINGEEP